MSDEVLEYEVRRGDTFWGIAEAFYGDGSKYPILQEYNETEHLHPGDIIYIPPLSQSRKPQRQQQQHHQPVHHSQPQQKFNINSFRMQIMLNGLGYDTHGIDGIIGRNTQKAIKSFQSDYELDETGIADQETINTMHASFMEEDIYTYPMIIQALLHNAGYPPGAIDGVMGRNSKNALRNFQNAYRLYASGEADEDTVQTLKNVLYGAG